MDGIVIFCSLCGFSCFRPGSLVNHLNEHSEIFFCGIENCEHQFSNLRSFKSHLTRQHQDFYPDIIADIPYLSNKSIFCLSSPVCAADNLVQVGSSLSCNSPLDSESHTNILNSSSNSQDYILEKQKQFLEILVRNGCQQNVTFKALKGISSNLINFFSEISSQNLLSEDLVYTLQSSINTSEKFDLCLEEQLNAVFPEVVNISNSYESFTIFKLKPAIFYLLSQVKSFDQITLSSVRNDCISSYFSSNSPVDPQTIYLNLYVDDFQLANPLLRKQSLRNSLTGIYFRILTTDNSNFSAYRNIHLLALVKTKTFKTHISAIFQYIGSQLNPLLSEPFLVTINGISRQVSLKVAFFSTDSLAASELLGFKRSFNHRYCCRFCKTPRESFNKCFSQPSILTLRNHTSYLNSIPFMMQLSPGEDYFGAVDESPIRYLAISNFFEIFPPCIDHDVFEGILPKLVRFSLKYFISKHFFTLPQFHSSIKQFKLSGKDKESFPLFDFDPQATIRLTASEGHAFSRFYLLFLKNVPKSDNVYQAVELLTRIIHICMSYEFTPTMLTILETLVDSFLFICASFAPEISFTIKFHHLVHYRQMIEKFGPPRIYSTINFESLHSYLKAKIKNSKNWKLAEYTICTKYARSQILTQSQKAIEIHPFPSDGQGPRELIGILPSINYCLSGLKFFNQHYECRKSAILAKMGQDIEFIVIEKIFNVENDHILFGSCYIGISENCSKVNLVSLGAKNFQYLSHMKYKHSYQIYCDGTNLFVVPYFCLEII